MRRKKTKTEKAEEAINMEYDRLEHWKDEARKDPAAVLGFLAASNEAFVPVCNKRWRITGLAFSVVFALMLYLHGFTAVVDAIGRIFG